MAKRHRDRRTEPRADAVDRAHAPGKRNLGPAPGAAHLPAAPAGGHAQHQPWVPTSGLIGRSRRSARRG